MSYWIRVDEQPPPVDLVVETKIQDQDGCRNEQSLKLADNGLWFVPSGDMYVYYKPTHWRVMA